MAALTYEQVVGATGSGAYAYLVMALKTRRVGAGGGVSFFGPCLFAMMERDFRADPNKKKAILIWEMFLMGNYGTPTSKVLRPDPMEKPEWFTISLLDQNVESDGGVPEAVVKATAAQMAAIKEAYATSSQMGRFERWRTSGARKFGALAANVNANMFEAYVNYFKVWIARITTTDLTPMDDQAKKLHDFRPKLATLVETAGFTASRLGLK